MNNIIKFTMAAGVLALIGCSDSNVSGAAIEDNAVAQNSSSSKANGSSASMNVPVRIAFSTKVTEVLNVNNADISVYGEENGAEAGCTADGKSFEAKLKVNDGLVENSIEVKNFGSSCDSVLAEFVASCQSRALVFNGSNNKESCDEHGNVIAYCVDDRAIAMTVCTETVPGTCTTKPAKTTIDFNELFKDFSKFSGNVCNAIFKGASSTTGRFTTPSSTSRDMSSSSTGNKPTSSFVDSNIKCLEETGKKCNELEVKPVDPRQELPSYSAIGIDTNSNRSFVIKPNVEVLNVSDAERSILDSLARAYPQKTKTDDIDGMTIFLSYAAEYPFTTEKEEYYVRGDGSERSEIDVYREEKGVKSSMVLPLDVYYGGQGYISVTTLQVSESSILYLVRATLGSYASQVVDSFRTECEATSGSFYDYGPVFMADVAVACAVKNFSGITFDGILSQQKNLFRNAYATFVQPVVD
jgi:hypothetical protein